MAWLTVDRLEEHLPLDVYDANGILICRAITGFDSDTGEVESFVFSLDGKLITNNVGGVRKRHEKFPPPLTWKSISPYVAAQMRYWDLDGR